jgi:RNA polymerase-binding transcription factor DksA
MTRDDARLKRLLEEEQAKLEDDIAHLSSIKYRRITSSNHMAESATAAYDQASNQALLKQLQHRLQRVERALAKFENGTYGYCENCGKPIDFARLKALPDARFCLQCQRERETMGGRHLGPRALEQGDI